MAEQFIIFKKIFFKDELSVFVQVAITTGHGLDGLETTTFISHISGDWEVQD